MGSIDRKQSALYAGRPIPLGDRKLTIFQEKPTDPRASTRRMKSFTTEMIEYTKPPHLRTQRFEGPKLSIFGIDVNDSTDQEDLANLDLTRSRSTGMQVIHERTLSQYLRNSCILRVSTKPEERDVVDVIKERLRKIRKPYEPAELSEGLADVLIMYKTSKDDDTRLLLRAHSRVLMRHCDAFVELLESGMREMTLREYLDRQFMRSRQFDEESLSTEYETEPSLGWCRIQHPEKPIISPRVVTEAFLALQEARNKANLPPRTPTPPTPEPTEDELLEERQQKEAFDIVKESHKLVKELAALELPEEIREQYEKFAAMVAECAPLPEEPVLEEVAEVKVAEDEEDEVVKEPEPWVRTVRISFSDYAPPGWVKPDMRDSISRRMSPMQKKQSQAAEMIGRNSLVRGSLLEGEIMKASDGEGGLVGGEMPAEEPKDEPFDANLVRGSLQRGSLRKGSVVRESMLDGNLVGSEIDPPPVEEEAYPGPTEEELATARVEEEHRFFADFLQQLDSTPEDSEPEAPPLKPPPVYELDKTWTAAATEAVMEYLYTEKCHVPCQELPEVFEAANELLLTELSEAITLVPLLCYLRLALMSEANRSSLLELCKLADSVERPELRTLEMLCKSYEYGSDLDKLPYTFTLHTGYIPGRKLEFVTEGFHLFNRVKCCILRVPEPGMRLFLSTAEQARHLIFTKPHPEWVGALARINLHAHYPRKFNMLHNRNRDKAWFVTVFGPKIAEECYYFYKHIQDLTFKPMEAESFSLRMVMGFLTCPMLQNSIIKAFPKELKVEEVRGAGYFIGGESHCNSITMTGEPRHLLAAAKSLPKNMVGRTSFRVAFPSKKTFIKLYSVAQTFGIDLEMNVIYLLKNLPKIIQALQFFLDLSDTAFVPWEVPREIVELVAPCDPF